jgi:hypothetical protein
VGVPATGGAQTNRFQWMVQDVDGVGGFNF